MMMMIALTLCLWQSYLQEEEEEDEEEEEEDDFGEPQETTGQELAVGMDMDNERGIVLHEDKKYYPEVSLRVAIQGRDGFDA